MARLNDSKKRDFISQLIVIISQNKHLFTDKGFDPEPMLTRLQQKHTNVKNYEAKHREAMAAAKDSTQMAKKALDIAYTDASEMVDLISGLMGKKDNLLLEIKKIRNSGRSAKKTTDNDPV